MPRSDIRADVDRCGRAPARWTRGGLTGEFCHSSDTALRTNWRFDWRENL